MNYTEILCGADVKAATQRKESGGGPPVERGDAMERDRSPLRGGLPDRPRDWRDRYDISAVKLD